MTKKELRNIALWSCELVAHWKISNVRKFVDNFPNIFKFLDKKDLSELENIFFKLLKKDWN